MLLTVRYSILKGKLSTEVIDFKYYGGRISIGCGCWVISTALSGSEQKSVVVVVVVVVASGS